MSSLSRTEPRPYCVRRRRRPRPAAPTIRRGGHTRPQRRASLGAPAPDGPCRVRSRRRPAATGFLRAAAAARRARRTGSLAAGRAPVGQRTTIARRCGSRTRSRSTTSRAARNPAASGVFPPVRIPANRRTAMSTDDVGGSTSSLGAAHGDHGHLVAALVGVAQQRDDGAGDGGQPVTRGHRPGRVDDEHHQVAFPALAIARRADRSASSIIRPLTAPTGPLLRSPAANRVPTRCSPCPGSAVERTARPVRRLRPGAPARLRPRRHRAPRARSVAPLVAVGRRGRSGRCAEPRRRARRSSGPSGSEPRRPVRRRPDGGRGSDPAVLGSGPAASSSAGGSRRRAARGSRPGSSNGSRRRRCGNASSAATRTSSAVTAPAPTPCGVRGRGPGDHQIGAHPVDVEGRTERSDPAQLDVVELDGVRAGRGPRGSPRPPRRPAPAYRAGEAVPGHARSPVAAAPPPCARPPPATRPRRRPARTGPAAADAARPPPGSSCRPARTARDASARRRRARCARGPSRPRRAARRPDGRAED